jgi:hypothetical protein
VKICSGLAYCGVSSEWRANLLVVVVGNGQAASMCFSRFCQLTDACWWRLGAQVSPLASCPMTGETPH